MALRIVTYILSVLIFVSASASMAQNTELKSGAYIGTDAKITNLEFAKDPFIMGLLASLRDSLKRAYVIYDHETGKFVSYAPQDPAPETSTIDFTNNWIEEASGKKTPVRIESDTRLVFFDETYGLEFAMEWVDQNSAEFKEIKQNYQDALEKKRARQKEINEQLQSFLEPKAPLATSFVVDFADQGMPYIFNIPPYWTIDDRSYTLETPDFYSLGITYSQFGQLTVQSSSMERVENIYETVIQEKGMCHQTEYANPNRKLVVCFDQTFDRFHLSALIDHGNQQGTIWLMNTDAENAASIIENVVRAFQSVRSLSTSNENRFSDDPNDWPDFEMTQESQLVIGDGFDTFKSVSKFIDNVSNTPFWGSQTSIETQSNDLLESIAISFNYMILTPEEFAAIDGDQQIEIDVGTADEGMVRFYKHNNACLAAVRFPVISANDEHISDLYLAHYEKAPPPNFSQDDNRAKCVILWKTLRAYKKAHRDMTLKTEWSKKAYAQLSTFQSIYSMGTAENKLYHVRNSAGDKQGVLNADGDIIVPVDYSGISLIGAFIVAKRDGKKGDVYTVDGKLVLQSAWENFSEHPDLKGFYILRNRDEAEMAIFNGETQKIQFKGDYKQLKYLPARKRWIATLHDDRDQLLDFEGKPIGERYLQITALSGTANYLIELTNGEDVITDADLNTIAGPFASALVRRDSDLIYAYFEKGSVPENESTKSYYDFSGKRVTSPDMVPVYVPSEDGYITVQKLDGTEKPKWGVIDRNGQIAVPFEYDQIHMEREGVVPVAKNEKFGLYSLKDGMLTKFKWKNITLSYNHTVMAQTDGRLLPWTKPKFYWTLMDWHGNPISNLEFQSRPSLQIPLGLIYTDPETKTETPVFLISLDGKFGLIGTDGNIVLPFENELNCDKGMRHCYDLVSPDGKALDKWLKRM